MTGPDPLLALAVLEKVRDQSFPDLDPDLVKEIYAREHQDQFEEQRGPVQAAIRDLIEQHVDGDSE